jgi:hypothetical protein
MLPTPRSRFLDILGSIYIYNEHRGYSSIDRVLEAVRARQPGAATFIAAVEKHRRDERAHYVMFKRWFEARGVMPFAVDRTCGHIDRLIRLTFGCHIDDLDTMAVAASTELFNRLCRIVMITEQRGMRQVEILLKSPAVQSDRALNKIFKVIERDEPSHFLPYAAWLAANDGGEPTRGERLADAFVHKTLVTVKVPLLYMNPRLARRTEWYDAGEVQGVRPNGPAPAKAA